MGSIFRSYLEGHAKRGPPQAKLIACLSSNPSQQAPTLDGPQTPPRGVSISFSLSASAIARRLVNVVAAPGSLSRIERRRHRLGSKHRASLVANNGAYHLRAIRDWLRLDVGEAGQTLNDRIVNPLLRVRTGLSYAADRRRG